MIPPRSSLPILVADQDEQSRNRLAHILEGEGFRPLPVRTGGEAVEVVRKSVVAITILDVLLPDLTGIETFELITAVRGDVPGIFLARERSKDMLVRLLDAGAFTVLQKPPRIEVLLETVRRLASRIDEQRDQRTY
ncbi:MAG: response regulator [Planctomycetota bacterium]